LIECLIAEVDKPMRRFVPILVTLIVGALICAGAWGTAGELKSGPQKGEKIPGPFHYLNINGDHAGNPHCLVCEYALRPVVLIFSREIPAAGKPLWDLLQKLDAAVDRNRDAGLKSFVVILNDDIKSEMEETRLALVRNLEGLVTKAELKNVVVSVGEAKGPEKYVAPEANVSVLLYHKHKVEDNRAFRKDELTEKDVTEILAAVNKMVGAKK
jgi:hypothetical protein